jgi:hypothetical protein
MAMRKFKKGNLICYSNIFILEIKTKRYVYSTLNYYEIIPIAAIDKDYKDEINKNQIFTTGVGNWVLINVNDYSPYKSWGFASLSKGKDLYYF